MSIEANKNTEFIKRIIYVLIFTLLIYLTLPLARYIVNQLSSYNLLRVTIYSLLFLFLFSACFFVIRYIGAGIFNILVLASFLILYIFFVNQYSVPAEKFHFVEYGILAFLVYYALKLRIKSLMVYPLSLFLVFIIGWGDELIQKFLPGRVYDIRDVVLNFLSGALILLLIFISNVLHVRKISRDIDGE